MVKKNVSRIASLVLAVLMLLSMAACGGKMASLKEFAESEEMKSQLKTLQDQVAGVMEIDITGEDNKLIYTFTFLQDLGDTSGMEDSFKEMADGMAPELDEVFTSLKSAVKVENPVIVMRFVDMNGKELFSQEFHSEK